MFAYEQTSVNFWDSFAHIVTMFNPRRAGVLLGAERAGPRGWGVWTLHRLTRLLGHVAARGKRHSKERQKLWRNWFGHFIGQVKCQVTRGHEMSNLAYFNIINRPIYDKLAHNTGTRRARVKDQSTFDSSSRTCRGGVGWTPMFFSQITRVKRGGSPRNLQYSRVDRFDTYCENFKSMSCQVIKLWRHMSGHVRTKSVDFAICRTRVRVLAS